MKALPSPLKISLQEVLLMFMGLILPYQERMAQREEKKLSALQEICKVFSQVMAVKEVLSQQEFLVLWGEQEVFRENLDSLEKITKATPRA